MNSAPAGAGALTMPCEQKQDHMVIISGARFRLAYTRLGFSGFVRQVGHKIFQPLPVFGCQGHFQSIRQRTLQATFPTGLVIVQISPPAIHLSRRVDKNTLWTPHNAGQRTLGQHCTAANTSPLRNMFRFTRFRFHGLLPSSVLLITNRPELPFRVPFAVATFMFLAAHDLATVFIEFQFHRLLAFFALLILLIIFIFACRADSIGAQLEQFLEG